MKILLMGLSICVAMLGQDRPLAAQELLKQQQIERNKILTAQNNELIRITDSAEKALAQIDLVNDPSGDAKRSFDRILDAEKREMIEVETKTLDQLTQRRLIKGPDDLKYFVDEIDKLKARLRPAPSTATLEQVKDQIDVVLGKRMRTLALLERVTTWYRVDPSHPDALAAAKELRRFYRQLLEEGIKLSKMYIAYDESASPPATRKEQELQSQRDASVKKAMENDEVDSKLRQLEAMGFDHKGDGWN